MSLLVTLAHAGRRFVNTLGHIWTQIWFQPMSTTPLEIIRIGLGSLVFLHYAMATPYLLMFWGNTDWMPPEAALLYVNPWTKSLLFYFSEPWHWYAFHALFLFCTGAFVLGWRT